MKNRYFFPAVLLLLFSGYSVSAQITADSVPPGMYAYNPNLSLSVGGSCEISDSATLDMNCDDGADMMLVLFKGYTAVDYANTMHLIVLNDSFEICADSASFGWKTAHFYNAGDPLVCPSNSVWASDSAYGLGEYGCLLCYPPFSQTDVFIAYRKLGQVGWMKISFDLVDGGSCVTPITATIHLILSPCLVNDVAEVDAKNVFEVSPNPFSETVALQTRQPMKNGTLVIYNAYGQEVRQENNLTGDVVNVERGDLPGGVYFFCLSDEAQFRSTRKVIIADN